MSLDSKGGARRLPTLVKRPAVFLDRDGTINREVDYLSSAGDFELLPGASAALRALQEKGFALVVVTNQSGIARGLLNLDTLDQIHRRMTAELEEAGVTLDWIGSCPHHPTVGPPPFRAHCSCRKPSPGLLLQATAELVLDLDRSWCVGDSLRDLEAADAIGVRGLLVRTGKGSLQEQQAAARGLGVQAVDDLAAASDVILEHV